MCKMVVFTVQNYADAKVHTIRVGNRELFWVKMIDVENGLGIKNVSDLVRKDIQGIYETKGFTKKQKNIYIRTKQEISKKPTDDSKIKVGLSPSKKNCVICFIESPLKMMKNAFYFILKTLFVLKIFKFLSWLFGHVGKTA